MTLRGYVAGKYIEIENAAGDVIRMPAVSLIQGKCSACSQVVYVTSRIGDMVCPHCLAGVDWAWGEAKMAFIPDAKAPRFSTAPPPPKTSLAEAETADLDQDIPTDPGIPIPFVSGED